MNHCGTPSAKIEELWNNQDTSQSWLSNQTRHLIRDRINNQMVTQAERSCLWIRERSKRSTITAAIHHQSGQTEAGLSQTRENTSLWSVEPKIEPLTLILNIMFGGNHFPHAQ